MDLSRARWVTERQPHWDGMPAVRERRLGCLSRGTAHVPDGLLVRQKGNEAIKVELMARTL